MAHWFASFSSLRSWSFADANEAMPLTAIAASSHRLALMVLLPLLHDSALTADDARPGCLAAARGALRAGPNIGCRLNNNSRTRLRAFAKPQRYSSTKVVEKTEPHIF